MAFREKLLELLKKNN